jgi:hypothetical protein
MASTLPSPSDAEWPAKGSKPSAPFRCPAYLVNSTTRARTSSEAVAYNAIIASRDGIVKSSKSNPGLTVHPHKV